MENKLDYMNIFKNGLYILSPTSYVLGEMLSKTLADKQEKNSVQSLEEMEENADKQEISDRLSESQAKVLQELAIARRIETADEVEIEEYFDSTGEGNVGVKASDKGVNVGVGGSGRRVVKRVYRFKGWNQEIVAEIEKEINSHIEKED
ncbi:hypothetical protein [Planomicrobium okeanokoites]|uniref:Uncharacterized protein n=1 Tax=Planomicrobium okeanokoites TaxID=244 RepID=A0ABV7KL82_PLAOK|nr:hypothetical protein [Planomicrobium okeanokoites]TAA69381.1 hypothetical protein D2910_08560 [Planomicrobium okeanokoites]